jgi:hypothetical protein
MNASSIQAPSQAALALIDERLQSGKVDSGPIFLFDSERNLFVYVEVIDGQMCNWRVEPCPSREVFRARVDAHVAAAGLLAWGDATAMQSAH